MRIMNLHLCKYTYIFFTLPFVCEKKHLQINLVYNIQFQLMGLIISKPFKNDRDAVCSFCRRPVFCPSVFPSTIYLDPSVDL